MELYRKCTDDEKKVIIKQVSMPIIGPISLETIEDVCREVLVECLEEEMALQGDISIFDLTDLTTTTTR